MRVGAGEASKCRPPLPLPLRGKFVGVRVCVCIAIFIWLLTHAPTTPWRCPSLALALAHSLIQIRNCCNAVAHLLATFVRLLVCVRARSCVCVHVCVVIE